MLYKILSNDRRTKLATAVNEHLREGWILQGGVAMSMSMSEQEYCQAMVKEMV